VEIVIQSHHAAVSDGMRDRAMRAVEKLAARLRRAVDAVVRFEEDGPTRRVEIVLHAPRQRRLVACGESRFFGPALAEAVTRLEAQARQTKATLKARTRAGGRAGPRI
jgi:ribosome-associated translation inhibitor RaiA